tara:strand:- start:40382 stop:42199 length:1818 start_codon:yes stop_codon:yes gene_type:complete
MSNVENNEPTEALRELMKGAKRKEFPGFKTRWKALNRILSPTAKLERGKSLLIGGLEHNYKTGLLTDLFVDCCVLNSPDDVAKDKSLNIYITTETLKSMVISDIYESMTGSPCDNGVAVEDFVNDGLGKSGFHYQIFQANPNAFDYDDLINKLQFHIDTGWDIHCVFIDNVLLVNDKSTSLDSMLAKLKEFMTKNNILFVGTHWLSQKAHRTLMYEQKKANNTSSFLENIVDDNLWFSSNQVPRLFNVELFVDTVKSSGDDYLHVARGMGDGLGGIPFKDRNFYLPFSEYCSRVKSDVRNVDISIDRLRSDPLELKTNRFKPDEILFESGGFVIASGTWTEPGGTPISNKLACRWHPDEGVGYPNGRGYPQWMNLGRLMKHDVEEHKLSKFGKRIKLNFDPDHSEITVGNWVKADGDWFLVNYVYGSSGSMVSAMGRGKSGPFPIEVEDIDEVETGLSTLGIWHAMKAKGDYLVWITPRGALATTKVDDTINQNGNIIQKNIYLEGDFIWDNKYQVVSEHIGFTYMLDGHYLIGKLPGDLSEDELHDQVRKMGRHFAVDVIRDIKDLKEGHNVEHRMEDEIGSRQKDVFHGDLLLDAIYYDVTEE